MRGDHLERGEQALARLLVEALDALAKALDRLAEIVALGAERGVLGLDLAQFLLGAQIDGADPLAVAPQFLELRLDLGHVGQRGAGFDAGEAGELARLDFQHLADFVADVGEPPLGGLMAFLGAGRFLARRPHGFERGAGRPVGRGERILALGQLVGGRTAARLGGFDLA